MSDETSNGNGDIIEANVDAFVTTTTIRRTVEIVRLLEILRLRKTTGDLCLHFNQGGIRRIELSERTGLTNGEADRVRELLDMD